MTVSSLVANACRRVPNCEDPIKLRAVIHAEHLRNRFLNMMIIDTLLEELLGKLPRIQTFDQIDVEGRD